MDIPRDSGDREQLLALLWDITTIEGTLHFNNCRKTGRIDLSRVDLSGKDLSGIDFSNADLSGARLVDVNFWGADLSQSNLREADLRRANLIRVNLRNADVTDAILYDISLIGANLWGGQRIAPGTTRVAFDALAGELAGCDREIKRPAAFWWRVFHLPL